MRVVIDTNVFLVIIPSLSRYHLAYQALKENRYDLVVSNEILLEYEEQLSFRYQISNVSDILHNLLENQNIHLSNPAYKWNLISQDVDDNKFVDKTVVDYTQPTDVPPPDKKGPIDSSGTFALQGHDPGSTVYFKNIMVRVLGE